MSDLLPYNARFISSGNGFINLSNICYFNSLLQCILSCSAIFETLELSKDSEHIKRNPLLDKLIKLNHSALAGESISTSNINIWRDLVTYSKQRKSGTKINDRLDDHSQQDMHEGLLFLLDTLTDHSHEIRRLFEHRHNIKILCPACKKYVVNKYENNLVFEVQPDLKSEQHQEFQALDQFYNTVRPLGEFLRKQNDYVDHDFICPNAECKSRGIKFKTTELSMIPEILPIVLKKYGQKVNTTFPEKLQFTLIGGRKKLVYELVAQCEHLGNMHGGHYYAICKRRVKSFNVEGRPVDKLEWLTLNDGHVSAGTPGPTANTYMIFYHFKEQIDV